MKNVREIAARRAAKKIGELVGNFQVNPAVGNILAVTKKNYRYVLVELCLPYHSVLEVQQKMK